MFKQTVVKNCPVTRGSRGLVRVSPEVIGELAGALDAERGLEWLVLLTGERSADGLDVLVTGLVVPGEQERHSTEVLLPQIEVGTEVMGVLHSHHDMGARFSRTDDTKLNPRFDLSIVISSRLDSDEAMWLGFSYQAEGTVRLPCGEVGRIGFDLAPDGMHWPVKYEMGFGVSEDVSLGDCGNVKYDKGTRGDYYQARWTACEQLPTEEIPRVAVFGKGAGQIAPLLPKPAPQFVSKGWKGAGTLPFEVKDKRASERCTEQSPCWEWGCVDCDERIVEAYYEREDERAEVAEEVAWLERQMELEEKQFYGERYGA